MATAKKLAEIGHWMASYDALPPEMRAALREAAIDWDPREELSVVRQLGRFAKAHQLAENIRQRDRNKVNERMRGRLGGNQ